jgi:Suv3 helical N-terminal domain
MTRLGPVWLLANGRASAGFANRLNLVNYTSLLLKKPKSLLVCPIHICRSKSDSSNFSHLFVPVPVKIGQDDINVGHIGAELTGGEINKDDLLKVLNKFYQRMDMRQLAKEHGLDRNKTI